jgi:hypothetical protein
MATPARIDFGQNPTRLAAWTNRCLISGARALSDHEARVLGYDPGAVIPTNPRPTTIADLGRYAAGPEHPAAFTVQFTRFDQQTLALLGQLGPWATGQEFWLTPTTLVTFSHQERFAASPDQLTTTPNLRPGRHTLAGFHRDNSYPEKYFGRLEETGVPPRRLGVCRAGEHYLALAFATELDQRGTPPDTGELRAFVADGGQLDCIWVRVSPGMAYAAPLRVAPHVGSSWQLTQDCEMVVCVGHWQRDGFAPARP